MIRGSPILLVADNAHDAASFGRALPQAGALVAHYVVPDIIEAIEYLGGTGIYADRFRFPLPALLITAAQLRLVKGFDLRIWLQGQLKFQRLPKIALTRSPQEAAVMRSLTMNSWACLIKPKTTPDWIRLVRHLRDNWLQPSGSPMLCAG